MSLYRLVYCSLASETLTLEDVKEISRKASLNNAKRAISGGLLYCESQFLQVLEGGLEEVNYTFSRIVRDERHHDIKLIEFGKIPKRLFRGWDMSLVFFATAREFQSEYSKFSATRDFNPLSLDGNACAELVFELLEKQRRNPLTLAVT
ncbi:MAG: BLUF domain-containing protein [Chloroherpetonaceae bacterium]|nr:BLUF domain-containing protein [Chloroherpetonaceae bacterium]MCS7211514.1 BLUF domain-containing protein [Chloroherpetonaceae bacterium]MDW8019212.1 BLUF domain-containing protein [Chloroherpetonaceae bacterium]